MKKVIIITYYNAPNYGAFLQAYAMQSFLEENRVEAYICSHKANKKNFITRFLDFRIDNKALIYREELQSIIDKALNKLHINNSKSDGYDLAIIGSDEIWNVKNLTAVHLPLFFKPYRYAAKTISYAACAGSSKAKHLRLFPYTRGIMKLDAVSVRDDSTEQMIQEFSNKRPVRTLDPTFLYNFSSELPGRSIQQPYLFVYTYGLEPNIVTEVQKFAKEKNLLLVATGSRCPWAEKNPIPGPFEWLSLIKNSKYVITSTFHGSVFSIIFNKQFVAIGTQSNKVKSLLEEIELSDFLAISGREGEIQRLLAESIDYDKVNKVLEKRRLDSKKFVLNQIQTSSRGNELCI